jgi:hypothetical protein
MPRELVSYVSHGQRWDWCCKGYRRILNVHTQDPGTAPAHTRIVVFRVAAVRCGRCHKLFLAVQHPSILLAQSACCHILLAPSAAVHRPRETTRVHTNWGNAAGPMHPAEDGGINWRAEIAARARGETSRQHNVRWKDVSSSITPCSSCGRRIESDCLRTPRAVGKCRG